MMHLQQSLLMLFEDLCDVFDVGLYLAVVGLDLLCLGFANLVRVNLEEDKQKRISIMEQKTIARRYVYFIKANSAHLSNCFVSENDYTKEVFICNQSNNSARAECIAFGKRVLNINSDSKHNPKEETTHAGIYSRQGR